MFRKLRLQLTVVCAISTGLVLILMAYAAMTFTTSQLREQADKAFHTDINSVFYYLNTQTSIDQAWLRKTEANSELMIRINAKDKDLLHTTHNPIRQSLTDEAREYARVQFGFDYMRRPSTNAQPDMVTFVMKTDKGEYRAAVATVMYGEDWLGVTILKDTAPEKDLIFRVLLITSACVFVALIALIIFSHFFIGYVLKPVEENRKRQSEFVSSASHELRSPLAVMSASAGAIKKGTLDDAFGYANKIEMECTRLSRLTSDLLKLASADSGTWSMEPGDLDPETMVIQMAERFEALAEQRGTTIEIEMQDTTFPVLHCDEQRIEQVLTILMDNALSYTSQGGSVWIGTYVKRRSVYFTVADNGSGVPDDLKDKIFDRFYRGNTARTDKEHYGIGLSVAWEIALLHKGNLFVRDARQGGAEFVLKIPY